jgi:hypothetical protein
MKKIILILLIAPVLGFSQQLPDLFSEKAIRSHFDKSSEFIEGIWEYKSRDIGSYRLAIFKDEFFYKAYVIEESGEFKVGDLKATFERLDGKEIITKWIMGDKKTKNTSEGEVWDDLRTINIDKGILTPMSDVLLIKTYPKK